MHAAVLAREAASARAERAPTDGAARTPRHTARERGWIRKLRDPTHLDANACIGVRILDDEVAPDLPLAEYDLNTKMRFPSPARTAKASRARRVMDPHTLKSALHDAEELRKSLVHRRSPLGARAPLGPPPRSKDAPSLQFAEPTPLERFEEREARQREAHLRGLRGVPERCDWKPPAGQPDWVGPLTPRVSRSRRPSKEDLPSHLRAWSLDCPLTADEVRRQRLREPPKEPERQGIGRLLPPVAAGAVPPTPRRQWVPAGPINAPTTDPASGCFSSYGWFHPTPRLRRHSHP